jgi:predicted AlkP superfamily pyrophosphatase or phosphodiesterase
MVKFIVYAIDALEYEKVHEYGCEKLMQDHHGKTDISEFSEPRTMVLWSSFMTGENKEEDVLIDGDKEMWSKRWDAAETFFSQFKSPAVIDLPGYSYDLDAHERSRKLLKAYFTEEDEEKKPGILKDYNDDAFAHHKNVKEEFLKVLDEDHDFILGYFSVVDVIGHLNFGKKTMMKILYKEMEDIYGEIVIKHPECKILVLSDHGMEAVGMFGDHSEYGFWSTNFADLGTPKITDMAGIIKDAVKE